MTTSAHDVTSPRRDALAILARAAPERLSSLWAAWWNKPEVSWIRAPETGLIMVQGRVGGGGDPFNVGEATVSRASAQIDTGEVGHGYCLGRDTDKVGLIAIIDALFQREPQNIDKAILSSLRDAQLAADQVVAGETAATRVDFFTVVRGEDE